VFALFIPVVDVTKQNPSIIAEILSNFFILMVDISEQLFFLKSSQVPSYLVYILDYDRHSSLIASL
jgi:hypothetical protein